MFVYIRRVSVFIILIQTFIGLATEELKPIEELQFKYARLSDEFDNIFEIVDQGNTLQQMRNLYRRIHVLAETLNTRVSEVREKWDLEIESLEHDAIITLNNWAKDFLKKQPSTNDTEEENFRKETVGNYVNKISNEIYTCADLLKADLQNYETKVLNLDERYRQIMNTLTKDTQNCGIKPNQNCQRRITIELRKLDKGPKEYSQLISEGSRLIVSDFEYQACVAQTWTDIETGVKDLQEKINSRTTTTTTTTTVQPMMMPGAD